MNTSVLKYQFRMLVLGFGLWAGLGILGKVPLDPLIALMQMGLGGLITMMLKGTSGAVAPVAPAPPAQSGFASIRLLTILAAIVLGLSLAGCSTVMRSYEAAAYNEIKSADDNTLAVLKVAFCGQPLSAFLRNTELIPGAKALCLPAGNAANPDGLLTPGQQPITINLTMPAAPAIAAGAK